MLYCIIQYNIITSTMSVQLYLNNILFITKMWEQYGPPNTNIIILEEKIYLKHVHNIKECINILYGEPHGIIHDILRFVKYIDDGNDIVDLIENPNKIIDKNLWESRNGENRRIMIKSIAQYYFNKKTQDDIKILTDENKKLRELLTSYITSGSIL